VKPDTSITCLTVALARQIFTSPPLTWRSLAATRMARSPALLMYSSFSAFRSSLRSGPWAILFSSVEAGPAGSTRVQPADHVHHEDVSHAPRLGFHLVASPLSLTSVVGAVMKASAPRRLRERIRAEPGHYLDERNRVATVLPAVPRLVGEPLHQMDAQTAEFPLLQR